MKRIILALVVILISTNTLHAANFKWTKIVTTADGATEFYIDKNSVKKVGKFHYYWMLANYLKLEEGDDPNVKSNITSNILNCETSELKNVTLTSFNLNNVKMASSSSRTSGRRSSRRSSRSRRSSGATNTFSQLYSGGSSSEAPFNNRVNARTEAHLRRSGADHIQDMAGFEQAPAVPGRQMGPRRRQRRSRSTSKARSPSPRAAGEDPVPFTLTEASQNIRRHAGDRDGSSLAEHGAEGVEDLLVGVPGTGRAGGTQSGSVAFAGHQCSLTVSDSGLALRSKSKAASMAARAFEGSTRPASPVLGGVFARTLGSTGMLLEKTWSMRSR